MSLTARISNKSTVRPVTSNSFQISCVVKVTGKELHQTDIEV